MSTADLELFGPPEDAEPRFTTVLRGFDPEQVRGYLMQLQSRIDTVEQELDEVRGQRDSARRRYSMAREDAYNQLASRMAELLKVADAQADRIRREAEEDARRQVTEARQLAHQTIREAEAESERLRRHGEELVRSAESERERILGGLAASRDATIGELLVTREHMQTMIGQLDVAVAVAQAAQPGVEAPPAAEGTETDVIRPDEEADPDEGDLLVQGFEIMLPEFMAREEPDQEPERPAPDA